MKLKIRTLGALSLMLVFGGVSYAQSSNVVSAALEFKKFETSLMMQKADEAKENIIEAKRYIDPAMNDATTNTDPKAHYYNALINFGIIQIAGMDESEEMEVYRNQDSIIGVIRNSIEVASSKKRWKQELDDYFNAKVQQAEMIGQMMFKQKQYEMAFLGFASGYQIKDIAGIEEGKEDFRVNSIISARNVIDTLVKQEKTDKALEFISAALELFPKSEEIAIEGVNLALSQDNLEKAEEYFNNAAEAAPTNKALFANMGSIFLTTADKAYRELTEIGLEDPGYGTKSDEVESLYAKAEKNLKKALELDPKYAEAAYNLGVLYLGKGEKLKTTAAQMDFNNPNYEKVSEESKQMFENAIAPLEIYIEQDPNNAGVLQVLFQVHRNAGNTEKALEYKRRAEEVE